VQQSSPTSSIPPATGPLAGVRVLDLSSVIMGPYATQILGDLGADVICVEDAKGDTNRIMGPGPVPGMSGVSLNLLRNKRNVCLDLKHADGRAAFLRVAATCDVLLTNLRPGPLGRLGLTYDAIRAVRPDIVMCQAHGWPSGSPDADKPAYDDVIQGSSGIAHAFELQTGTPALAPTLVADKVSGLTIAYAVMAALFHRERTGEGQFVEVPMIDALTSFTLVEHGCAAIPEPALGPAGYPRITAPDRRPFRTLDGWLSVLPYSAANYDDLFREGGRTELVGHAMVQSARERNRNAATLYAAVAPIVATRTTAFWVEFCERHDIPAGAVRTLDELTAELPMAEHPLAGAYREIPPPVRFAATPASVRRPAPMLGEHGREVLLEAGVDAAEVDALAASGALRERS
jgi:crotonobetainyl-CoA:carnitine CoA-transferase CaiB-like acyl-CoA transferase